MHISRSISEQNDTFYDSQYFWSLMECIECYMNLFEKLIKIKIDIKIGTQQ